MITREQIVAQARTYLDVKYRHQGRSRDTAVDCVGLVMCVAADLGIPYRDVGGYSRRPDGTLMPEIYAQTEPVAGPGQAGDLAIFHWAGEPMHVAIMTSADSIIHAFALNRMVCEHRLDAQWRRRIACFRAVPGVA